MPPHMCCMYFLALYTIEFCKRKKNLNLVWLNCSPQQMFTERVFFFKSDKWTRLSRSWLFCTAASCLQLQRVKAFYLYMSSTQFLTRVIYAHKMLYLYLKSQHMTMVLSHRISSYCHLESVLRHSFSCIAPPGSFLLVIRTLYSPE